MKKGWIRWSGGAVLSLASLCLGGLAVVLLYRYAHRWLFWAAVVLYVQAILGCLLRLWLSRPGGYREKEAQTKPQWQPPEPVLPRRHCPMCGQPVAGDDCRCRFCGAQLEIPPTEKGELP